MNPNFLSETKYNSEDNGVAFLKYSKEKSQKIETLPDSCPEASITLRAKSDRNIIGKAQITLPENRFGKSLTE